MKNILRNIAIGLGLVAVGGAVAYKFGAFDGLAEDAGDNVYPDQEVDTSVTDGATTATEADVTLSE